MGQLMVFRREALDAVGLERLSGELVDDMHIGARVVAAGFRNVVSPRPLRIVVGGTGLLESAPTFRRWMIFSRSGVPGWSFKWPAWARGAIFWTGLAGALFAATASSAIVAALFTASTIAAVASVFRLHALAGGVPVALRHSWIGFAIFLGGPFAILSAVLRPNVTWCGRDYRLDRASRLAGARVAVATII